ncbi:MAG: hypothetical protein K6D55_10690, partial [Prevotella sp.]|nr:hypothetical protein [Prevotella sp.]
QEDAACYFSLTDLAIQNILCNFAANKTIWQRNDMQNRSYNSFDWALKRLLGDKANFACWRDSSPRC